MKKPYIIAAVILISFMVLMYLFFGPKKAKAYLVVGDNARWQLKSQWEDITPDEATVYQGQKFNVLSGVETPGQYTIKYYDNKWYAFGKNNEYVNVNAELLATNSDKIKLYDYETKNLTEKDLKTLKEILAKKNILDYSDLSISLKISIDFNGDGKKENLYTVSNLFVEDDSEEKLFSLIYYIDEDGKTKFIKESIVDPDNEYDTTMNTIVYFIDIDDDKKLEIITKSECFNNVCEPCYEMYELKRGEYKNIKTCEE